jgi:DedD protein
VERYVIERLVGAAVLVAVGIILIPEMLSGPRDRVEGNARQAAEAEGALKSYKIDLTRRNVGAEGAAASSPGQPSTAAVTDAAPPNEETDALAPGASRTSPLPAPPPSAEKSSAAVASKPEPPAPPATAAVAAAGKSDTASKKGSGGGAGWAVQIASYAASSRAQKVAGDLKTKGFDAFVMPFKTGDKTLYRVRVGPEDERKAADADAAKLRAHGITGAVVKHP